MIPDKSYDVEAGRFESELRIVAPDYTWRVYSILELEQRPGLEDLAALGMNLIVHFSGRVRGRDWLCNYPVSRRMVGHDRSSTAFMVAEHVLHMVRAKIESEGTHNDQPVERW